MRSLASEPVIGGSCRSLLPVAKHDGVAKEAHLVRDPKRLPDLRALELDRPRAHAQELRDLAARLALADQIQDLSLPGRQAVQRRIFEGRTVAKAPARDLGRDVAFAGEHVPDRAGQLVGRSAFGDEAVRAALQRKIGHRAVDVHGHDEDPQRRECGDELRDEFEPVAVRHGEVEEQHIGFQALDRIMHFSAIAYRSNDRVRRAQELAEPVAHERVVVGDEDGWASLHGSFSEAVGE